MTAKECIMGRRSIRQFTNQAIGHDLLSEIVETATYSPSWKHTQIVRYIAIEGEVKDVVTESFNIAQGENLKVSHTEDDNSNNNKIVVEKID